jgi:hypothetical protein
LVYVLLLLVFEKIDLLADIKVASYGTNSDGKLGREFSNMVKLELSVNFIRYLWHKFKAV